MNTSDFHVSKVKAIFTRMIHRHPKLWVRIGNIESSYLEDKLQDKKIIEPIYVAGLARSGTTILLEMLETFPELASHKYLDFPPVFTPYWWNRYLSISGLRKEIAVERAHKDRIKITSTSPESIEEPIWMAFFDYLHDPGTSNILNNHIHREDFEKFYAKHIKKILLIRNGSRYLSKANYNITRLEYIIRMFPDARFIIPVRDPVSHIASLIKQHAIFTKNCKNNKDALQHLQYIGHFEFGEDRRPINTCNTEQIDKIQSLWDGGDEISAWAMYWSEIYKYIFEVVNKNSALRDSTILLRYEELCSDTEYTIRKLLKHCNLPADSEIITVYTNKLDFPDYYQHGFSETDIEKIRNITHQTASLFGYK